MDDKEGRGGTSNTDTKRRDSYHLGWFLMNDN